MIRRRLLRLSQRIEGLVRVAARMVTPKLLTRLRDRVRRLHDEPGRVWAKCVYAKVTTAERARIENLHLAKVLEVLYRRSSGLARGRRHGYAEMLGTAARPWSRPTSARATREGPLEERVRNEPFVQFLLEGTEWQAQPKKDVQEDHLGTVEVRTPPKGKKKHASRRRH